MMDELLSTLESPEFDGAFRLAANTTEWLYRWIGQQEAVLALDRLVMDNPSAAEALAVHALELLREPTVPGCHIDREAALCCYAFILSHTPDQSAHEAMEQIAQETGPSHGWLGPLMNRCAGFKSTTEVPDEPYLVASA